MHRLLTAFLTMALFAPLLLAQDKVPGKETDKKDQPSPTTVKEVEKEFLGKIQTERDPDKRKEVLQKYSATFLAVAQKDPKSDEAFDAIFYVLRMGQQADIQKGSEILLRDHIQSPKIGKLFALLSRSTDEPSVNLLKGIIAKHPDKKVQAKACQTLIKALETVVTRGNQIKEDAETRERAEKALGKEVVQKMVDNVARFEKEQKEYARLLDEKYGDVVVNLSVGKKAPEVISKGLDGSEVKLSDLKGKVVVLDIWATWCGPCRAMIPHEREMVKNFKDKPFALISISADADKETLVKFLKETPMPWTHWWNGASGGIIEDWNVEYFPTIYVLDHTGVIRFKDVREKKLEDAVETLLKELDGKGAEKKEDKKEEKKPSKEEK